MLAGNVSKKRNAIKVGRSSSNLMINYCNLITIIKRDGLPERRYSTRFNLFVASWNGNQHNHAASVQNKI